MMKSTLSTGVSPVSVTYHDLTGLNFSTLDPSVVDGSVTVSDGDAKVPGTELNATGDVPCARYTGQPMRQCRFGVVREGGGSGWIKVFWPDGGNRVIFFEKGAPSRYDESQADAGAKMRVRREADLFMVRIGDQRFEIPEAALVGG